MFHFTTFHVIENPKGHAAGYNYSLVGSVPAELMDEDLASAADVMAGRAYYVGDKLYTRKGRKWETIQDILDAATAANVPICESRGCACRKLF